MTRPLRIARVITRLNVGGPARQAILLTDHLRARGHRTLLLAGRPEPGEGEMTGLARTHDVDPVSVPDLRRPIDPVRDLRALGSVLDELRRFRPDVVHTHMAKAGTIGRLAGRAVGARAVCHTFHGHALTGYFGSVASLAFRSIEAILGRVASDAILCLTRGQRDELVHLGAAPPGRARVVPLGLDLEPFRRAAGAPGALRSEGVVGPTDRVLGLVGRLVPVKRPRLFLEVIRYLRRSDDRVRGVMCGDGPLRDSIERRVAGDPLLGDAVHVLGIRADIEEVYPDLDVLVIPSRSEGTPACAIEAMAAGLPVVATPVGGVPELLGGVGLLRPADPLVLAAACRRLLEDADLRNRCIARGRARSRRYGIDRLVDDLESLYLRLARGR